MDPVDGEESEAGGWGGVFWVPDDAGKTTIGLMDGVGFGVARGPVLSGVAIANWTGVGEGRGVGSGAGIFVVPEAASFGVGSDVETVGGGVEKRVGFLDFPVLEEATAMGVA